MKNRVLYITYDGLLEPLGQSQVLQYLKGLSSSYDITIVSYEKKSDWDEVDRRNRINIEISNRDICWYPLRYHKSPTAIATFYDILVGMFIGSWLVLTKKVQVVHARSYVSSVIALLIKKVFKIKFIFDMRGFWADERVGSGILGKASKLYQVTKWLERRFLLNADAVVSLTDNGVEAMTGFDYLAGKTINFHVIPTCTDLEMFKPINNDQLKDAFGLTDCFVVGYVGSVGNRYLFDEVIDTFNMFKKKVANAFLLVLNKSEHEFIISKMKKHKMEEKEYRVIAADYSKVSDYITVMDCGLFYYKPTFSAKATSPTKLGEFLACGVPCLGNSGVGDVESILEGERVGIILHEFSSDAEVEAVSRLLGLCSEAEIKNRCVEVASRYFSLAQGVKSYGRIYDSLGRRG